MKNIYLVGFMGTGKTETGKLLAKQLKRDFMDMDELIVSREKMPIPEIFKSKGEPYFRKLEKEIISDLFKKKGIIVACGGGAFVGPENIKILKESGTVICLTSSPEVILKRTLRSGHRPLLNVDNPKAAVEELLKKRLPSYVQAHHTIDADQLTVEETTREILKILK